jgi:hypothetical protein
MNTLVSQHEQVLASGMRSCRFIATPVTFFPFGRQAVDRLEFSEVEIGDGLEGFGCGGVAEPFVPGSYSA